MIAQQGDSRRFVGREYQLGEPTAFTLPDPIGGAVRGGAVRCGRCSAALGGER